MNIETYGANLYHDYYRVYYNRRLAQMPEAKVGHDNDYLQELHKRWTSDPLSAAQKPAFDHLHGRLRACATHYLEGTTEGAGFLADGGYAHQSWKSEVQDLQIGMAFDFTTGVPFLKGSGLKGMLRSHMWPTGRWKKNDGTAGRDIDNHRAALNQLLADTLEASALGAESWNRYLFEGYDPRTNTDLRNKKKSRLYPNQWVSFLGAATCFSEKTEVHFQINDLTPQKTPTKKPVPLKFLSVRPGVKMRVYFCFPELAGITKAEIQNTLTMMAWHLNENGLGAKTSYGYGRLTNLDLVALRD